MSKKRRVVSGVLLIAAVLAAIFFFNRSPADSLQLAGVKEITLSPSDVELPSVKSQLDRNGTIATSTRYDLRQDGNQYHLYFVGDGKNEKVIGGVPTLTEMNHQDFDGFTDVISTSGTTTYATYTTWKQYFIGFDIDTIKLYALKGNRASVVLSDIKPGGIQSMDKRIRLIGAYFDQRQNLYVLTSGGMLCVIQDGQIVGKANLRKIGVGSPPGQRNFPSMFSDSENTFLVVGNSVSFGPVNETQEHAKYRVNF